ncbi:hypothetical protein Nepgr_032977 [Nepenthes gracilis]|uniref:Uncharacterized protein n=1 Tax=Nepenthes gracilis TaxID=150966 RepID=A0AAD3TL27_NEPGR|nr:hypothetical protein Nepgr_032977 [Nepenthes gracilis]
MPKQIPGAASLTYLVSSTLFISTTKWGRNVLSVIIYNLDDGTCGVGVTVNDPSQIQDKFKLTKKQRGQRQADEDAGKQRWEETVCTVQ